jgi:hypothetical protein
MERLQRSKKAENYFVVKKTRFYLQHARLQSESRDFLFRSSEQEGGPAETYIGR